jgi:hypothetical protein
MEDDMFRKSLLALVVAGGLTAASAQAAVSLPSGTGGNLRFQGISAFDTSSDPTINVATGVLTPNPSAPPLTLTAFGEVTTIFDAANSNNRTNPYPIPGPGELTFTYTGATLTPIAAIPVGSTSTSVTYQITSTLSGGTITLYDDNGSGANLDTKSFVGTPAVVPGAATDGTPYLVANTSDTATSTIVIQFFKATPASNYSSYKILLQSLNEGSFTITGGSILSTFPGLAGQAIEASQTGIVNAAFSTVDIGGGVVLNANVDSLVEGGFNVTTTVIPEPASIALLGLGGLLLFSGARARRMA